MHFLKVVKMVETVAYDKNKISGEEASLSLKLSNAELPGIIVISWLKMLLEKLQVKTLQVPVT